MVKNSYSEMQKGIWNEDEDENMVTNVSKQQGTGNWTTFSKRSGHRKSGKNSRERWSNNNNQKADPREKSFTPQEEELVIQLHAAIGSRWPIIAQQLPGRTDNDVKILWNNKLRKKLSAMGIDPVTHKPFSQILADYGNIGAFPKARTRFSSLSKDLKNTIVFKSEQSQQNQQTFSNHFSLATKQELFDQRSVGLYSQLQAINLLAEASNHTKTHDNTTQNLTMQNFTTKCAPLSDSPSSLVTNQDVPSFSWSDFFLEDAFLAPNVDEHENGRIFVQCDGNTEEKAKCTTIEDKNSGSFEASSSSNSSSFVDAMLESQDAMFSQLSCFSEEPFYY